MDITRDFGLRQLAFAFVGGAVIAWAAIFLIGILAALPMPSSWLLAAGPQRQALFFGYTMIVGCLPVIALATVAGWGLFRLINRASPLLVVIVSLPWFLYVAFDSLTYLISCGLPRLTALSYLLAWYNWPGTLAVPAGLILAAWFMRGRRPPLDGARPAQGAGATRTPEASIRLDVLLPFLLAYAGASFWHHLHNAQFLRQYPNMPLWLSPVVVYGAWLVVTAFGVIGYVLIRRQHERAGLCYLGAYGLLGLAGLDHYAVAPMAAHTWTMNLTIWFEVITAVLLLTVVAIFLVRLPRSDREAVPK